MPPEGSLLVPAIGHRGVGRTAGRTERRAIPLFVAREPEQGSKVLYDRTTNEVNVRTRQLLRSVRTQARLSLRAAASAAGVDGAALSRYENGRKIPRSDTLERLLETIGYELDVRPARSTSARFIDALCEHQAQAILNDPGLVARARDEMPRLEGRSASYEVWRVLLDAGPLACIAVLTSTSETARPLKADSPFAYVVDLPADARQRLLEGARAA